MAASYLPGSPYSTRILRQAQHKFEPQTGIRAVCMFLELSGLSLFVGSSYGAQQKIAAQIETETIAYEAAQEKRLVPQMPKREVSVAEDETFHPEICLVCIEPVSGFILLEKYVPQRDAETWTQTLKERLLRQAQHK